MEWQASISPEPAARLDSCHIVEVTGQVRGVQMHPPGDGDGGEFQLLLDSGDTIVSLYPTEWHLEVASNLQANYMLGAKVRGIGEYSPNGELRRIRKIESFDTFRVADWQKAFLRYRDRQNGYERKRQTPPTSLEQNDLPDSWRPVRVIGQTRGIQMRPPSEGYAGGEIQLLLENGDIIPSPYPDKWHSDVVGSLQANDIVIAEVRGIGEYSPEGRLRRIRKIESFDSHWWDHPRGGTTFNLLKIENKD